VHLCDALFPSYRLDLLEARFRYVSALKGLVASPDPIQVGESSGSHGALSSLQAPGSTLQRLDVRLRLCLGGFFSLDPRAPYVNSSLPRLRFAST
jgi:hypothetical protein